MLTLMRHASVRVLVANMKKTEFNITLMKPHDKRQACKCASPVQHNEKKEAVDTCQSAFEISVLANKLLDIFCCTAQKLI